MTFHSHLIHKANIGFCSPACQLKLRNYIMNCYQNEMTIIYVDSVFIDLTNTVIAFDTVCTTHIEETSISQNIE